MFSIKDLLTSFYTYVHVYRHSHIQTEHTAGVKSIQHNLSMIHIDKSTIIKGPNETLGKPMFIFSSLLFFVKNSLYPRMTKI